MLFLIVFRNPSSQERIVWSDNSPIGTKYNYQNINPVDPLETANNTIEITNTIVNIPLSNAGDVSRLNGYARKIQSMQDAYEAQGEWGNGWNELTIEAWIKNDGSTGDFQTILSGNEGFVHFQMYPSGGNNVIYLDDGMVIILPILPDVNTEWRHVALVAKSGDSRIYQNGALVGNANALSFGNAKIVPTGGITIGGNKIYERPLKGKIADVRVWNVARTQDEIITGMHSAPAANANGLIESFFTDENTFKVPDGIENYAQQFDLSVDINVPGSATQNLKEVTIEAWINNSSVENDIQAIVSATGPEFVHMQMSGDANVNNAVYLNDNRSMMLPCIPKLSPGWHHVAMSIKSGHSIVVIDGKQVGETNTTTFSAIKPSGSFGIGKGWQNTRRFNGKIANVRIWNTAKSIAELKHNADNFTLRINGNLVYHSPTNSLVEISSPQHCIGVPSSATTGIQNVVIEAWINNTTAQEDIQAIVSAAGPDFVHFQMSGSENVNNAVYLNDGRSIMLPCIPKLTEGWHHVAMVVESGNSRILLDGKQLGNGDSTIFSGIKDSNSVNIGKGWQGGRIFNGKIADVRIWKNKILTNEQINMYSSTPPPVGSTGLAFHLR